MYLIKLTTKHLEYINSFYSKDKLFPDTECFYNMDTCDVLSEEEIASLNLEDFICLKKYENYYSELCDVFIEKKNIILKMRDNAYLYYSKNNFSRTSRVIFLSEKEGKLLEDNYIEFLDFIKHFSRWNNKDTWVYKEDISLLENFVNIYFTNEQKAFYYLNKP